MRGGTLAEAGEAAPRGAQSHCNTLHDAAFFGGLAERRFGRAKACCQVKSVLSRRSIHALTS